MNNGIINIGYVGVKQNNEVVEKVSVRCMQDRACSYSIRYISDTVNKDIDKKIDKYNINILILDVNEMSDKIKNILKKINNKVVNIIVLTKNIDVVAELVSLNVFGCLIKPVIAEKFEAMINEAVLDLLVYKKVILNYQDKISVIDVEKIVYIESLGDESAVYTDENVYYNRYSLKKWCTMLNENMFYRCHKSFIVSLQYIDDIQENIIKLKAEKLNNIPVSVRNKKILKDKIEYYAKAYR